MNENQKKFIELLKEMFQLNNSDLDFGIYRVLKIKQKEISKFLDKDLTKVIDINLENEYQELENEIRKEIERLSNIAKELGRNPDDEPKIKELKIKLNNVTNTKASLESDIYSRLYDFFSRYYKNGDFISLRRYKNKDTYAIPYNGEEVKLYWANFDQYYIKTSEFFKNFNFKIENKKIAFKIKDVEEEKDNNKEKSKKFIFVDLEENENELNIYFEFKKDSKKQETLNKEAIEKILNKISPEFKTILSQLAPTQKNSNRTILEKYLTQYTSKNMFDFFIHKDLKGFLERELEFYIKNEMLCIDDLDDKHYKQIINKIKIFKQIANKIIEFLSQLENFQKKLWEKKKFVIETNYCITLDKIDEKYYEEIISSQKKLKKEGKENQIDEWKRLFDVDIKTVDDLKQDKFLVLDTKFFDRDFKYRVLSEFDNLDKEINGVLINSENYQALNLLINRYKEQIKIIYIDPPYNAPSSEILYLNNFKHSSWLTLMENRIRLGKEFLRDDGIFECAIDDNEQERLGLLLDMLFPNYEKTCVSIIHNPSGTQKNDFLMNNEFTYFIYKKNVMINPEKRDDDKADIRNFMNTAKGNTDNYMRYTGKNCFYPIIVDKKTLDIVEFGDVCDDDFHPEDSNVIKEQYIYIYPIDENGIERKWVFERKNVEKIKNELFVKKVNEKVRIYRKKNLINFKSVWTEPKYSAKKYGTELLTNYGLKKFDFPKSIYNVYDCIYAGVAKEKDAYILDFFAGSGTTGDAVIKLNREDEDKGKRKYILVEMGEYFDEVLKTRIQKVIYSDEWKDGKPQNKNGISQMFKYLKLESYEDTLNNIDFEEKTLPDNLKEEYMLKYFLDIKTKKSLFNIDKFKTPFNYKLKIATSNVNETDDVEIDLIETFNYLLGIVVEKIDYKQNQILIKGKKENKNILIIWRDIEKELNLDINLDEFDEIYINGDNEIGAKLIESEFKSLMFKELG